MIKRLAIATSLMLLGSSGAAMAAACTSVLTTSNSETFSPGTDLAVDSGAPVAPGCEVSNVLDKSAANTFVNYRVDTRITKDLPDGYAVYTVTGPGGDVREVQITDAFEDGGLTSQYFALGENPGTGLDADFDMVFFGNDFFADVTSIDIIVGTTTLADQEAALAGVGQQQVGLVTHLGGVNDLLTGAGQKLEGDNEFAVLGGLGSYQVGVRARYNLAEGLSVLGGTSLIGLDSGGASANGISAAGALRYVAPGVTDFRLFGEGGVQVSVLSVGFTRNYENQTTNGYDATGNGDALLGGAYLRGGALWTVDDANEVVISASIGQSSLGISNYVEDDDLSIPNFFAADLSGSTSYTTIKTGVDWTAQLTQDVDLTASGAVGATFGSGAAADVFGVGTVNGDAQSTIFAQYGLRLGWELSPGSTIDGYLQGTTGTNIGTHAQIGAAYRLSF